MWILRVGNWPSRTMTSVARLVKRFVLRPEEWKNTSWKWRQSRYVSAYIQERKGNVLFNNALNTFCIYQFVYPKQERRKCYIHLSFTHARAHTHMHTCTHAYMHICMHACTHMHAHTYGAISCYYHCSTTGVTKNVVCTVLSVRWYI